MTNLVRASLALSLASLLTPVTAPSTNAIGVDDLGVRLGEPAHISLSTGFNGVVGAGIKHLVVGGQTMDGFCIDPFTGAVGSSQGYSFVPLTQAPEAPWTLNSTKAVEIKDLWAMFYSPNMSQKNAAGLQLAIWEIVGGSSFQVIGKDYHASEMLAELHSYTGPGADLIALTGPDQDYVVQTPPGEHNPTPTPTPNSTPTPQPPSTPTPTPHSTSTPTPHSTPTPTPPPTSTPTPTCTRPPGSPPPHCTPPPKNVPDSGATLPLFAVTVLILLAMNMFGVPALARVRVARDRMSVKRP
jgi:hypothetical protein